MRRFDDWPFVGYGSRGTFAYGFLTETQGDGERAAWTLLPALPGIELRPPTSGEREPYPGKPTAEDNRIADLMAAEACEAYAVMLDRCLPRLAVQWRARTDAKTYSWQTTLARAHDAFWGWPHCERRMDLAIHDAAREHGFHALLSASGAFGHLVWDRGHDNAWWLARRCGEFFAKAAVVLGEDAWAPVERVMR